MPLSVFISYAKENQATAVEYYKRLLTEGLDPWLDVEKILPGQRWEFEIDKALKQANVIVLLLSRSSVNKRGFVQREAQEAMEQLRYKKEDDIYILPLLLEPCDVPVLIANKVQYIEMSSAEAWPRVFEALSTAAEQQKIELQRGSVAGLLRVFPEKIQDSASGFPGYDVTIEYPRFASAQLPTVAQELSMMFGGRAAKSVVEWRSQTGSPRPDLFPSAEEFPPINYFSESFGIAHANDGFLSITCDIGYFYAGAAHGNAGFETFNFVIDQKLKKIDLQDFFSDPDKALLLISSISIERLSREFWERTGEKPDEMQLDQFRSGAGPKWGNFDCYNITAQGFTFLFPPYQVGPYALGSMAVAVSFYELLDVLQPAGPHLIARKQ